MNNQFSGASPSSFSPPPPPSKYSSKNVVTQSRLGLPPLQSTPITSAGIFVIEGCGDESTSSQQYIRRNSAFNPAEEVRNWQWHFICGNYDN
jgi:hypothetical protein